MLFTSSSLGLIRIWGWNFWALLPASVQSYRWEAVLETRGLERKEDTGRREKMLSTCFRSFQHPSSSRHSYAPGFNFSWPSQRPQHRIFSEARPGPYRCSTMCGASRYTGPSTSPTAPSSSPHLFPGVPLAPGVVDASCNSCCFSAHVCSGNLPTIV